MADKTKIDWADATWNPVTGCLHGCEYCYARRIANRFGGSIRNTAYELRAKYGNEEKPELFELERPYNEEGKINPYPFKFSPTLYRYKLDEPKRWAKPRTIFVCSMADLFGEWVPDEWIMEVFAACLAAPQHRYLFLTKAPERYKKIYDNGISFPKNFWIGASITRSIDAEWNKGKGMLFKLTGTMFIPGVNWFASVEPILEEMSAEAIENLSALDWVIAGAETGNRKDKVIPKKEWIMEIKAKCEAFGVPLFMKESLRGIMGEDFRQEYPWEGETK